MYNKYLLKLEYNKILNILSNYCTTDLGKNIVASLFPSNSKELVSKLLAETDEACLLITKKKNPYIFDFEEVDFTLKLLESSGVLDCHHLLNIAQILSLSNTLKTYFFTENENYEVNFPILSNIFNNLYTNPSILSKIRDCILDDENISDTASATLLEIRKKQKSLESKIKDKLNSYIHSSNYSKYIQDDVITIRNDRYVIPVREEYKSNIKGFIHDISSSGSTVFIEPLSIFDLNNELNNLKSEELIEIQKILQMLSSLLYPILEELKLTISSIGKIDFILAKANYSIDINGVSPILNDNKYINLLNARHPLISKDKVVPISVSIGSEYNTLLITGPNTGGKTVTLKTIGLLSLMAQSGLHIPCSENSSFYIFDNIFADIGDEQSIQDSLSTFSSHMVNIIEILKLSTNNSLVLIDELGSGTDPIEGSSLAISILESFYAKNCITICTTHYSELKNYALTTPGFKNASVEFDIENLRPTYRLLVGIPGKSNAFAISEKLGLSKDIINRAASFIDSSNISIEELLKNIYDNKIIIENEKENIEKNLKQIESLRKDLEQQKNKLKEKETTILDKAKQDARKILLDAKQEASDSIKEINSVYDNIGNDSLKQLNNIRNKLNTSIKETASVTTTETIDELKETDICIGMNVLVTNLNQVGTVLTLPKRNQVQIQVGNTKLNVKINNLQFTNKKIEPVKNIQNNSTPRVFKSKTAKPELNVIGLNVDEAVFLVDKYLDDCSIAKLSPIRIVHGKGTGALRNGIHNFLKSNPHVKSFRLGTFGEGEMGVTVVELK